MGWAEVRADRIICHRGNLNTCPICGCNLHPDYAERICATCVADAEANPAFKAWTERQLAAPLSGSLGSGEET